MNGRYIRRARRRGDGGKMQAAWETNELEDIWTTGHHQPESQTIQGRHMKVKETSGEPDATGKQIKGDK